MARYTGPRSRIARKFQEPILGPSKSLEKKNYPPGMHGAMKKRSKQSEYAVQLMEKQKVKYTYGILERQFAKIFDRASRKQGITGENLLQLIEARLDNVIYRAGFVKTRRAARQMVGHGHVLVNNRKLNIPSYQVQPGDVVSIRSESRDSALFTNRADVMAETKAPAWVKFDDQGFAVRIEGAHTVAETEAPFSAPVIIQFYSR